MYLPNIKTLEHFNFEALGAAYESYNGFKYYVDNITDREKIYKILETSDYNLRDNLNIVFEAIDSTAQSEVVKNHYKNIDLEQIKNSYFEYLETTCLGYLQQQGNFLD